MRDLPHNGNLASSATQRAVGPYLELGDYDPWGLKVSVLSGLKARLNSLLKGRFVRPKLQNHLLAAEAALILGASWRHD
jgi:hypothetical protein